MLAAERHQRILGLVETRGSVRTAQLARELEVTDETIRRDLEQLDRERQLQRTHGGAIRLHRERREEPYQTRKVQQIQAKQLIAAEAAKLIRAGDTLYFDGSSTVLQLAPLISELPVTVITNSELVISTLQEAEELTLIGTGGIFDFGSRTYVGAAAEATVRRFRIDKLFFSGNGVSANRGVSEINDLQATLKETALTCTQAAICLADATKIGDESSFFFAPPESFDILLTNDGADPATLEALRQRFVDVRVVSGP